MRLNNCDASLLVLGWSLIVALQAVLNWWGNNSVCGKLKFLPNWWVSAEGLIACSMIYSQQKTFSAVCLCSDPQSQWSCISCWQVKWGEEERVWGLIHANELVIFIFLCGGHVVLYQTGVQMSVWFEMWDKEIYNCRWILALAGKFCKPAVLAGKVLLSEPLVKWLVTCEMFKTDKTT